MRLEIGTFPVREARFGRATRWHDGALEVRPEDVVEAVKTDPRVESVEVDLARRGESVRIVGVRDVVEPRIKLSGPGEAYPGVAGHSVETAGRGRTHRLAGAAVVECAGTSPRRGRGWASIIEMSGPAAKMPYSALHNVVVVVKVKPDLSLADHSTAVRDAAIRAAERLAQATVRLEPPQLEVRELRPVAGSLPRVAYIACLNAAEGYVGHVPGVGTAIYGLTRLVPAWYLHPNEVLDGAITARSTWTHANNPIVLGLYDAHGTRFDFLGCIYERTRWTSLAEKQLAAKQAAKLAYGLGAQGAIITWDHGGNDFVEVMETVRACEALGIKAVLMTYEYPSEGGNAPPLLYSVPEADAIVSTGVDVRPEFLPAVERAIGAEELTLDPSRPDERVPATAALRLPAMPSFFESQSPVDGWVDRYGFGRGSCFEY